MSREHPSVRHQHRLRERAERIKQTLMKVSGLKPKPRELPPVDSRTIRWPPRWFDCPSYDDCLEVAAIGNWASYTCERCPVYQLFLEVKRLAEQEAATGFEPMYPVLQTGA